MAEDYYYLKLSTDFFNQKAVKLLRKQEDGDCLLIIYQKMLVASLADGGVLTYEGITETVAEEVALVIDEPLEKVERVIAFLTDKGILEAVTANKHRFSMAEELTYKDSYNARRKRKQRARAKAKEREGTFGRE